MMNAILYSMISSLATVGLIKFVIYIYNFFIPVYRRKRRLDIIGKTIHSQLLLDIIETVEYNESNQKFLEDAQFIYRERKNPDKTKPRELRSKLESCKKHAENLSSEYEIMVKLLEGILDFDSKKYDSANEQFWNASKKAKHDKNVSLHFAAEHWRARSYAELNKYNKAIRIIKTALRKWGSDEKMIRLAVKSEYWRVKILVMRYESGWRFPPIRRLRNLAEKMGEKAKILKIMNYSIGSKMIIGDILKIQGKNEKALKTYYECRNELKNQQDKTKIEKRITNLEKKMPSGIVKMIKNQ